MSAINQDRFSVVEYSAKWQMRLIICVAAWLSCAAMLHGEDRRPNILFMFTDDQPQNCLGIMGNEHIQTPHLDQLARRGTLFNNAFVTTAICCSNRACILTGQQMYRHGITDFKTPLSASAFEETYPALLRQSGYRTGYLGKFAIGSPGANNRELSLPADKFDLWYGFPQSINFRQQIDGQTRYLTEVMTEKAIDFMRATTPDQPFCLTVSFKEPHGPFNYFDPNTPNVYEGVQIPPPPTFSRKHWDSQPEFIRKSLNGDRSLQWFEQDDLYQQSVRTFYRTVTRADAAVGAILDELGKLGLDDNTVVIFSSDHGSLLGDHGLSGKWLMYENSIRVPLIIYDPRLDPQQAAGRRDEMVLSIDLAPTMLALAGIEAPNGMQGENVMPIVKQEPTAWRSHFYYQHTYNTNPPRSPIAKTEGIRTQRWKYIRYPETDPVFEQLFDLKADPLEQTNLISLVEHKAVLSRLRTICDEDPQLP
jgi:arylsulfatase A-like enzyme